MHRAIMIAAAIAMATPASARTPRIGQPAPPATIVTYDGEKLSLADLRGQVVVLNFWATWCGPCKAELPLLDAAATQTRSRGLRVFAVATEDSVAPAYLKKLGAVLSFPLVRRMRGNYGMIDGAVPTNYVIDRAGVVRYASAGAFTVQTINEVLLPLLREPAPADAAPTPERNPGTGYLFRPSTGTHGTLVSAK